MIRPRPLGERQQASSTAIVEQRAGYYALPPSTFWGRHGTKVLIGGGLALLGGVTWAVWPKRQTAPAVAGPRQWRRVWPTRLSCASCG